MTLAKQLLLLFFLFQVRQSGSNTTFVYTTGFKDADLTVHDSARIQSNGLLQLTNKTSSFQKGHAVYNFPLDFKNTSNGGNTIDDHLSFSSTFVFAIVASNLVLKGHGITIFFSPSNKISDALPAEYLGLFNLNTNMNSSTRIFALEFDTFRTQEFNDVDDNHVGMDVNGLISIRSASAAYFDDKDQLNSFTLSSGVPIQAWIEYNGRSKQLDVTVSPASVAKPSRPLLSSMIDLSPVFLDRMYIGFSASSGAADVSHYILGWSFGMNGQQARPLALTTLPSLPVLPTPANGKSKLLTIGLPLILVFLLLIVATMVATNVIVRRKIKFAEEVEDWELVYGTQRFKYKDLFMATRGFGEKELLGIGGFGRIYRGILPSSKKEVAVKKVSHDSRQGMKEFVAEIVSLGRLRHRNLVQLLGYCRRKGELLLVYDYMPNRSLDRFLFDEKTTLDWSQRFRVIKGVAAGLLYLHEEWEQMVLHRDIKASNVLLDNELNGRLGDFGLARLYDHGSDPRTTRVVGTLGYMAPEQARTGKSTTCTDVYSFGAFLLEVATGRRPIDACVTSEEDGVLVDWVFECWKRGAILESSDRRLVVHGYVAEEMELVLKLGLMCSNLVAAARPCMRQVVHFLNGDGPLPELTFAGFTTPSGDDSPDFGEMDGWFINDRKQDSWSISESVLSGGR